MSILNYIHHKKWYGHYIEKSIFCLSGLILRLQNDMKCKAYIKEHIKTLKSLIKVTGMEKNAKNKLYIF